MADGNGKVEAQTNTIIMKGWQFLTSQLVILVTVLGAIFGFHRSVLADLDTKYEQRFYAKEKGDKLDIILLELKDISKQLAEDQKEFRENSDDYHAAVLKVPFRNGKPISDNYLNNNAFYDLKNDVNKLKTRIKN